MHRPIKKPLSALLCLLALVAIPRHVLAEKSEVPEASAPEALEPLEISRQVSLRNTRIFVGPEFSVFSINGVSFSSIGFNGTIFTAFAPNWGLGASFRQGFSSAAFTALFSEIDLQLKVALTGSLRRESVRITSGSKTLYDSDEFNSGGFRAQIFAHQYFLNTPTSSVPVPGAGVGLVYELPSSKNINYTFGIRADWASNNSGITFFPVQFFLGLGLWL